MCDGSIKTFQQTVMKMKKSISCQVLTQKYSTKNTVYKGFKINCSKAKIPDSWPKNSFCVFETLFSGRKNPRFFPFPKRVEKLEMATAVMVILNLRQCFLILLK